MISEKHYLARNLYEQGDYPASLDVINELLDDDPNDAAALFILGGIFIQTNRRGLAYNIMARCAKFNPDRAEVWVNYGRCQTDDPEGWQLAEQCFDKAEELNPTIPSIYSNKASLMIQQCKPEESLKYANKALELDPENRPALSCLGFAYLMLGDWDKGFKYYDHMMGHTSRPEIRYNDVPIWDGSPNNVIMVNGEQGIGDELIYSSFIEDASKENKIIYDCMPRLKKLMERSFKNNPNVYISGNRWSEEQVLPDEFMPTASCSIGSLGMYYRKTDEDFSGEPYLKPDPDMVESMRGLLKSLGDKPKIGIAWTGGTKQSRQQFRQRTLEEYVPLIRDDRFTFISLQYKDPSEEIETIKKNRGIEVHHFPWITEVKDYDLTAALVSELDLVISVPTSVTQLAGAVGTEAWVMVPEITGWLFSRENYVWANSVRLFRNKPIKFIKDELNKWVKNDSRFHVYDLPDYNMGRP